MAYLKCIFLLLLPSASNAVKYDFGDVIENFDLLPLMENVARNRIKCALDLQAYFDIIKQVNITDDTFWAWLMLDSSAKIPDGVLKGSLTHMGQFDECLSIENPVRHFTGKHCMLNVHIPLASMYITSRWAKALQYQQQKQARAEIEQSAINLFFGLCFPSSCSADDLNNLIFKSENISRFVTATAEDDNCWTNLPRELSGAAWAFIGFVSLLLLLTLLSTAFECYQLFILRNAKPHPALVSFSLYKNGASLFEVRTNGADMACLHGIRVLSMMWVVLGHTYEQIDFMPAINLLDAASIPTSVSHTFINNSFYSVDTFFFLSGLLVAFVFFRNMASKGHFDVPTSYIHRYLRLTPQFLFMILLTICVVEYMGKGPLWAQTNYEHIQICKDNWWSSILYLQNYINPHVFCLGQSWYLSADMQMYWISPFVLYPMFYWPKKAMYLVGALSIGAVLVNFGVDYGNNFFASVYLNTINSGDQFAYDYVPFHTRLAPYFVGIGLGFIICAIKARKIQIKLSKFQVLAGWCFSTAVCLGCIYGMVRFDEATELIFLESAFYVSFSRLGWALALSWVVFACIYGYGGVVNSFLSIGIFQPLGKLSYIVYLTHITLLDYRAGSTRSSFNVGDFEEVYEYLGTLVLANLIAIGIFLLVEAPVTALDRHYLSSLEILPLPMKKKEKAKQIDTVETGDENGAFQDTNNNADRI